MTSPLVMGLLPVTVLYAIFPGEMVLQLGFCGTSALRASRKG